MAGLLGASSSNNVGQYTSGYGHSGYGCCCCDDQGGDGGLLGDNQLLALLAAGAAAVAFLFMTITMQMPRRKKRSYHNNGNDDSNLMSTLAWAGRWDILILFKLLAYYVLIFLPTLVLCFPISLKPICQTWHQSDFSLILSAYSPCQEALTLTTGQA